MKRPKRFPHPPVVVIEETIYMALVLGVGTSTGTVLIDLGFPSWISALTTIGLGYPLTKAWVTEREVADALAKAKEHPYWGPDL